ncbi:N66 matrix protein-like [Chenopodium quinoa]|uniref:N66 matrix protein-like n=1 Tax=Chenopodium quinoa TaxID=63459 RepID=UPI000B786EB2|nr:N66 matrix protein-like [Chenopodium quinoa]
MPSGCLFCDSCGSYDHDSSMCSQAFVDGCDDVENNECEHVNFVSNANGGQRFDGPKNFGNRNSHPQGGFDSYNNEGYRNQGNQGFRGNYNNQGYSNQNSSHGYGNQGQSQGFGNHYHNGGNSQGRGNGNNNQSRGNFQNNNQRGPPPDFAPKPQANGENSYSQPSSFKSNLE